MAISFDRDNSNKEEGHDQKTDSVDGAKNNAFKLDSKAAAGNSSKSNNPMSINNVLPKAQLTAKEEAFSIIQRKSLDTSNISDEDDGYISILPAPPEEIREEAEEGRHLYMDFLREEIQKSGLIQPVCMFQEVGELTSERLLDWTRIGRDLRQMADAFSQSKEREYVKHRAKEISLDSLNYDHFFLLLQELFQGEGITRERILVLFFFCADVAIEALKKGFHRTFHTLLEWSVKYIATRVAQWVHDHGGWAIVLRSSLAFAYQLTATCAFLAVAFACLVYIRRNIN